MLTTTSVADPDLLLFYLDPDTALLCKNDSFYTTSFRPKKYLLFSNWYCKTINILHCQNKNRSFIVVSWVHCPNKISLLKKKHFCLFIGTVNMHNPDKHFFYFQIQPFFYIKTVRIRNTGKGLFTSENILSINIYSFLRN